MILVAAGTTGSNSSGTGASNSGSRAGICLYFCTMFITACIVSPALTHNLFSGQGARGSGASGGRQTTAGAKKDLLNWVQQRVAPFGVTVTNFTSSFQVNISPYLLRYT